MPLSTQAPVAAPFGAHQYNVGADKTSQVAAPGAIRPSVRRLCPPFSPIHESYEGTPEMNAPLERFRIRRLASVFTILATLSAGILIGSVVAHGVHGQDRAVDTRDATPLHIPDPKSLSTQFTQIAKEVGPAVVNINTETLPKEDRQSRNGHRLRQQPQAPENGQDGQGGDDDDNGGGDQGDNGGLQDFFNRFFGGVPGGPGEGQDQERRALGSGFIVDPRGYILTNNHVVDKADRIYVKLTTDPENDQGHRATVIGVDKDTDLAVIKIDVPGKALPTVKLGNSDGAQVGDWVEAIGSPFDLSQTVTAGIISAKNRTIDQGQTGQFQHFIQTDAAINPGNSGGPLLDMAGEVVGVNAAIITQTNGYQGIGFAIPSNTVINVYNQLIGPDHKVVRGSIGISFQPLLPAAVAKMYGASSGVLIGAVTPGGPADKAGLKTNDVIVSVDGTPIKSGNELVDNISPRHPGSSVTIGYLRNGQKSTVTVGIADRTKTVSALSADNGGPGSGPEAPTPSASQSKLGLTVADLPSNAPAGFHGVIVQEVKPGSFADELSPPIGPGLIIESVNRKPVRNKAEYDAIVSTLKSGDDVVFEVAFPRSGRQTTLTGGTLP